MPARPTKEVRPARGHAGSVPGGRGSRKPAGDGGSRGTPRLSDVPWPAWRQGGGAARRWAAVAGLVAVLVALPGVIGALPASDADVPAADLRAAVLASETLGFSGYAESAGGLALPVTDQLSAVADLFSDRTTMRVWWRGPTDSRVDVVTPAGETGIHRDAGRPLDLGVRAATGHPRRRRPLALPAPPDLLPSSLGRRLLSEATDDGAQPDRARRVAGRDALGPAARPGRRRRRRSAGSTSGWTRDSGLPLQVEVVAKGAGRPALDTRFLDLELAARRRRSPRSGRPPGAAVRRGAARPRSCSRPGGGSDPVRCRPSSPGCRGASSTACRRGDRALRPRRHPARRRAGARAAGARAAQHAGAGPDAVVDDAGHAGGRRTGRRSCWSSRPAAGRTC